VQIRLVSDKKLKRIQRKAYRRLQAKMFALWEDYANNVKTAAELFKACANTLMDRLQEIKYFRWFLKLLIDS